jgi:fluoride exporter
MRDVLLVGVGSGLGGAARYGLVAAALAIFGPAFPVGTLLANVLGSALIGLIAALARAESRFLVPPATRQLLAIGFCGGFTTYSFFGWHALWLAGRSIVVATSYVLLTTALSLVAVWLAYRVTVIYFSR